MATMLDREFFRDLSEHAQLTVTKISESASETGIPFIPVISTMQRRRQLIPEKRLSTTSFGEERGRFTRWGPSSGVLVVGIPYIVPRAWLHSICPETSVVLSEASKRDLKKVFQNRHLVGTDQEFEGSHLMVKEWWRFVTV